MPHVELSLSEPHLRPPPAESSFDRWAEAVDGAGEPCLLIDSAATIVAVSNACRDLLGMDTAPVGRSILDGVLRLLDFSSTGCPLHDDEVGKIPPLLAVTSARLARGLIRVRAGGRACTLDAVAAPLFDGERTAGSVSFFSEV